MRERLQISLAIINGRKIWQTMTKEEFTLIGYWSDPNCVQDPTNDLKNLAEYWILDALTENLYK